MKQSKTESSEANVLIFQLEKSEKRGKQTWWNAFTIETGLELNSWVKIVLNHQGNSCVQLNTLEGTPHPTQYVSTCVRYGWLSQYCTDLP